MLHLRIRLEIINDKGEVFNANETRDVILSDSRGNVQYLCDELDEMHDAIVKLIEH